jgi:nicotinate-nucleotide adenylyltransferase
MGERPRIGIMGGTFDPIHHGHLVAAEEARHALDLGRVIFVPAGDPWQKTDVGVSPAADRYAMVEAAIADNAAFEASKIDIERSGPTYTIDTLRAVTDLYPDADLYFITGADAILDILSWKDPDEVLDLATFVAVTRPGYDLGKLDPVKVSERVETLEIPALAISSTDVRARVAQGRPIRYLVPGAVAAYISDHGLYRT